jgi:methyl-accepting chemotaxis protein
MLTTFKFREPFQYKKQTMKNYFTTKNVILIAAAIFFGALLFGGARTIQLANRVRCGGELSNALVQRKDFIADILPPPGYIIEAHLTVTQILETVDVEKREALCNEIGSLHNDYVASRERWTQVLAETKPNSSADAVRPYEHFLVDAHAPADEFFSVAESKFLPAVRSGDVAAASTLYRDSLFPLYQQHRNAIDQAVARGTEQVDAVLRETQMATDGLFQMFAMVCLTMLASLAVCVKIAVSYWYSNSRLTTQLSTATQAIDSMRSVCQIDQDGNVVAANENFCNLLSSGPQDVVGKSIQALLDPKMASTADFKRTWSQVLNGSLDSLQLKFRTSGSDALWLECQFQPSRLADGATNGFGMVATDVTEQRKLAEELEDLRVRAEIINLTSIVSEADLKGDILTINEKFIEVSKYSREELIGQPHNTTRHPDMSKDVFKELWGTIGKGKTFRGKIKNLAKDGTPYYVDAVIAPVMGANGKPRKYIGVRYDITDAEIERQNAAGILCAVDNAFAYAEFSPQGQILQINAKMKEATGFHEKDVVGKHHRMLVHADFANSATYGTFWETLAAGEIASDIFRNVSCQGRDVWLQAVYAPVKDEMGRVAKIVMIGTDVTEAREKSTDHEGQLNALNSVEAIIEFDTTGIIQKANDNFLKTTGYTLAEIVGQHHSMFMAAEDAATDEYRVFWKNLAEGRGTSAQVRRLGKGGREVWLQASYNPIYDVNGEVCKVVKFAADITASKAMEADIAARQKQDELEARRMNERVKEILEVAEKVSNRDYSQKLTISGEDAIGQLGEGLSAFFAEKQQKELADEDRAQRERGVAQETSRKVSTILEVVNSVASGDFTIEIPDLGDDAVGQVAKALSAAVSSMKEALSEVSNVAGTVASAAQQMTQASVEISSGAQSQASSLEETASSLEEITSTVKQNSDNAQQARQLANGSKEVAERGGSVVSDAVIAMEDINKSSKKIADIITTIDEIAFQTNLLALNAAVEAARAGEQGRGFAVVAAEVRNLAQRSASAAKEIKTLIQDSVQKVDVGTELVNRSGKTLSEIVDSVKRVTDIVSEIAAASKEQLTGVEQVNKAVAQMDRVTQGNASQTEEMSGTAGSLLSHANQLTELVGTFKLHCPQGKAPLASHVGHAAVAAAESRTVRTSPEPRKSVGPTFDLSTSSASGVLEF